MLSSPKCLFWSPNNILVSFAPGSVLKGSKLKQVGFRVGCETPVSSTGPGMYVGPDRNKGWRRYFPRGLLRDYHPGCFRLDQSPSSLLWESAPLIHSPKCASAGHSMARNIVCLDMSDPKTKVETLASREARPPMDQSAVVMTWHKKMASTGFFFPRISAKKLRKNLPVNCGKL